MTKPKGRPIGNRSISMDTIQDIISLTDKGLNRPDIAKQLSLSTSTVYRYQKEYDRV